jgi:hypothetical protein
MNRINFVNQLVYLLIKETRFIWRLIGLVSLLNNRAEKLVKNQAHKPIVSELFDRFFVKRRKKQVQKPPLKKDQIASRILDDRQQDLQVDPVV